MSKTNDLSLTGLEVIKSSLRKLGVIESGGSPSSAQQTDGLEALNAICKSFDTAKWLPYLGTYTNSITCTDGTASYDLDAADTDITTVTAEYEVGAGAGGAGTAVIEVPLRLVGVDEYQQIPDKIQSGIPQIAYVTQYLGIPQATIPDEKIYIWPVPATIDLAVKLKYVSRRKVQVLGLVADYIDLPDEWSRYLIWQLAHDLSFEYRTPVQERMELERNANTALQLALGSPFNAQPSIESNE